MLGVGVIVTVIGTGTAWLVAVCRFPGRGLFEWALLLPLAVPTYIQAYVYLDAVHPLGPIPSVIRSALGMDNPRDLPLPEVRSLGAACCCSAWCSILMSTSPPAPPS